MMKKFTLFLALVITTMSIFIACESKNGIAPMASNVITYKANSILNETTDSDFSKTRNNLRPGIRMGLTNSGLHTDAFNVSIISHTFSHGKGTIKFRDKVTTIGKNAFFGCSGLTSITIPNSVTTIGYEAFDGCSGLTSITIPNSVTTIEYRAFEKVNNIAYSGTATGSPWGAKCVNGYVDGYLVYSDATKTTLCGCSSAATGEITIPNSVTTIGDDAFAYCSGLTSIIIPETVTTIGELAFDNCNGLTSVTIPNSVTTIGDYAFAARCLSNITVKWTSAKQLPTLRANVFPKSVFETLHVPVGTKSIYEVEDQWKDFGHIIDDVLHFQ